MSPLTKFASAPKGPRALRSLLQRESSLFPSPNPLPNQNFAGPPPPPPCRLDPKSCPAGLEIFGVRRRPAPCPFLSKITKKLLFCPEKHVSETRLRPSPTSNPPATHPCQPHPASGPSLSETGLPQVIQQAPSPRPAPLGRLVSSYASYSAAQADQAPSAQSETGLKVCQPETSLRPSPSALASGPA